MPKPTAALLKAERINTGLNAELQDAHAIAANQAGTIGELQRELKQRDATLQRNAQELADAKAATKAAADAAGKQLAAHREEIAQLRREVHDLELRNATLEGKLQRVEKFDPVPPAVQYADALPRGDGSPLVTRRGSSDFDNSRFFEAGKVLPPWYLRTP